MYQPTLQLSPKCLGKSVCYATRPFGTTSASYFPIFGDTNHFNRMTQTCQLRLSQGHPNHIHQTHQKHDLDMLQLVYTSCTRRKAAETSTLLLDEAMCTRLTHTQHLYLIITCTLYAVGNTSKNPNIRIINNQLVTLRHEFTSPYEHQ